MGTFFSFSFFINCTFTRGTVFPEDVLGALVPSFLVEIEGLEIFLFFFKGIEASVSDSSDGSSLATFVSSTFSYLCMFGALDIEVKTIPYELLGLAHSFKVVSEVRMTMARCLDN